MITFIQGRWRGGVIVRVCVCLRVLQEDRGGSPCLYVYAFVSVWASEDEQKAANRDRNEMDEVGDVCVHAALFVWTICQIPVVCVCARMHAEEKHSLVCVHLLFALKHAWQIHRPNGHTHMLTHTVYTHTWTYRYISIQIHEHARTHSKHTRTLVHEILHLG